VILAKRMLERMGYRVTGFKNPDEALAAFCSRSPGLLIWCSRNLSMPGMSGMEVSRQILQIRPDIPVLLATGLRSHRGCGAGRGRSVSAR